MTAALVSDNAELQRSAYDKGLPRLLCSHAHDIERDEEKGLISSDLASRSREVNDTESALGRLLILGNPSRHCLVVLRL